MEGERCAALRIPVDTPASAADLTSITLTPHFVCVPEPTEVDDVRAGAMLVADALRTHDARVLIASSRGGKIAATWLPLVSGAVPRC